jgi:hypothetical protein
MGLRDAVASDRGADEELLASSVPGRMAEDPRHAAALELADAYLGAPADVTADRWAAMTGVLSPLQLAELAMRLTKFSRNKVRVSLGLDLPEVVPMVLTPMPRAHLEADRG